MRRSLIFFLLVLLVSVISSPSRAQCPEDTMDLGICDTLYVKPWPQMDTCFIDGIDTICINEPGEEFPAFWYVHLLVTHDSNTFYSDFLGKWVQDSIVSFVIPLTWTHSNPTAYCSLSAYWNTSSYIGGGLNRSIFRDHGGRENRILDLQWYTKVVDLSTSPPYFRMMVMQGIGEQCWWEGSKTLLATLTFRVQDTMTVHIDSTFWPPSSRLTFTRLDAVNYIPRLKLPQSDTVLIADFSADPKSGVVPLTVQFTDLSAGNPTTWFWNFGDDSTSTSQHPTHTYRDTGYFDVKLVVSNATDIDSIIKHGYIQVSSLVADFSAEPQSGLVPLEVLFTDLSEGNPTSWFWNLGDDSTSTDQHPTHTYNDTGHYDVKLVVSKEAGVDSIIKYNYIYASCPGQIAGFVKDTLGQPIYPAEVEAYELGMTTSTDPSGYYELTNLIPDNYTLFARAWGYATVETTGIAVVCDQTTWVDFALEPEYFSVSNYPVLAAFNWSLATGDFNGDNNVDIMVLSYDYPTGITRLWGDGSGGFTSQPPIFVDGLVAVKGYFNSDDFLDLAVGCYDQLAILLNDGNGDFEINYFDLHGSTPLSMAKGYLDSDAHLDLVTTSLDYPSYPSLFKGVGNGDFIFVKHLEGYQVNSVDVGDFDKDGKTDLVLGANDSLIVLLGDGSLNFIRSSATCFGGIWSVSTMNSLADFNHDGNLDVIFALPWETPNINRIAIVLGDGLGGFGSVTILDVPGAQLYALSAGDFDGDNNLDFATGYNPVVKVYFGDGTGNFPHAILTDIDNHAFCLGTADFNKDGNTDIAASGLNDEVSVLLNTNPTKATIDDEFVLTGYTSVNLRVTDKYGSSANILANAIAGAEYFQKDCDLDSALDDRVYNFNAFPGRYLVGVTLRPDADPGDDWDLGIRINGSMEVFAPGSMKGPLASTDDTTYFVVTDSLPLLCQPIDDSCLCKDTLTLFWNQIEGTSQYHFQLDDDSDFGSPAIDSLAVADTSLSVTSSLSGEEYYWRVRSNGDVWSIFSETYSFFPYLCGDINGDCATDLGDVLHLISYLYKGGPAPVCGLSEDVNCDGTKDLGDVLYLISYLYKGGPAPHPCN